MKWSEQLDSETICTRLVLAAMVAGFVFLGSVLWYVQVFKSHEYKSRMTGQSMRRIRQPGLRGAIYDRNKVCMAGNRPSYCIAIYVEELRQPGRLKNTADAVEDVIDRVGGAIGLERAVTREEIEMHLKKRRPMPFLAWKDIDQRTLARWAESNINLPGVALYVDPVRAYPFGAMAAHVLGYLGRFEPMQGEEEELYHFYKPEMEGETGIEKAFNAELAGIAGGQYVRVDASGFSCGEKIPGRDPVSGDDITLTIDSRIQTLVEQAIDTNRGACVVMDPRNGEVLAMASEPSFDPNWFSGGVTTNIWHELRTDPEKPLVNRAICGAYPPGSTFKPMVVIAAIDSGRATESTGFTCPGYFQLGPVTFHCWKDPPGHGWLPMEKGIEQSCNVFFCQLGLQTGQDRIIQMARNAGLGRKTGIELGSDEAAGLVPDQAWKRRHLRDAWRKGDTCNLSIGQGALIVTPLQMAVLVSAVANGGHVYRPRIHLERENQGELVRRMPCSGRALKILRDGMYDVIQAPSGTGKRAMVPGVEMAGKTGTAEYGPKAERRKYGWMIVYAPFDKPRYAAAMVIEDAMSGGITVAPKIRKIMEGIFTIDGTLKKSNGAQNG